MSIAGRMFRQSPPARCYCASACAFTITAALRVWPGPASTGLSACVMVPDGARRYCRTDWAPAACIRRSPAPGGSLGRSCETHRAVRRKSRGCPLRKLPRRSTLARSSFPSSRPSRRTPLRTALRVALPRRPRRHQLRRAVLSWQHFGRQVFAHRIVSARIPYIHRLSSLLPYLRSPCLTIRCTGRRPAPVSFAVRLQAAYSCSASSQKKEHAGSFSFRRTGPSPRSRRL